MMMHSISPFPVYLSLGDLMGFINRVGRSSIGVYKDIIAEADDGYWSSSLNNTAFFTGCYTSVSFNMFARWTGITIPPGVTILSAIVRLNLSSFPAGSYSSFDCYFNDVNDAVAPTTTTEANAKVKTTAKVSQSFNSIGRHDIDVSSIIAELRASYVFDNDALMMLCIGTGSGSNYATYDDYGSVDCAKLIIKW